MTPAHCRARTFALVKAAAEGKQVPLQSLHRPEIGWLQTTLISGGVLLFGFKFKLCNMVTANVNLN